MGVRRGVALVGIGMLDDITEAHKGLFRNVRGVWLGP